MAHLRVELVVNCAVTEGKPSEVVRMSPIKDFKVTYEALNKEGSFSEGDTIAGTVTFTLTEETKVKAIVVKVTGEARVHWTEGTGDRKRSHSDHRRYFKDKQHIVEENTGWPFLTRIEYILK